MFFSDLFPQADLVLVEASRANADMAERNTRDRPQMKVLHRALWPSKTTLNLSASEEFSILRVSEKAGGEVAGGEVETVTMEELIAIHPTHELFIAKIDIEGAESMVLAQNNGWLRYEPIIFVEPHDNFIRHNASLAGLLATPAYQAAEIVVKGATLIFVPERTALTAITGNGS